MEELIKRLSRYSEQCLAERLDPDFAKAVQESIVEIHGIGILYNKAQKLFDSTDKHLSRLQIKIEKLVSDYKDCRNELCLKCGDYKMRHNGACDGCRWKDGG